MEPLGTLGLFLALQNVAECQTVICLPGPMVFGSIASEFLNIIRSSLLIIA